jgi:RNA polymerase sigma-70 factor (ECF subfamily)
VKITEVDDTDLIEMIVHGRTDALDELYERYAKLVYSIAYRIVGDAATAEEVTLDVFERVWERAVLYRASRASVSTWLSSMSHHRGIDQLRRARSRPTEVNAETPGMELPLSSEEEDGPEGLTEIEIERQRVRAALDVLPKEQRAVLYLAYFEGLTQREIVDKLGEPLGTVKTRLRLGMQKLRKILNNSTE